MQKSRRQTSRRPLSSSATPAVVEFTPDYTYIKRDLKRIGMLAGSFFILLIVLSFIIR
jgi:hypothetical protein